MGGTFSLEDTCPHCGEKTSAKFATCFRCGRDVDARPWPPNAETRARMDALFREMQETDDPKRALELATELNALVSAAGSHA